MIKRKASYDNTSRKEISIKLEDNDLSNARELAKSLGCTKGVWTHRKKEIFIYEGIEWSLVETPKEYFYFEAEKEVESEEDVHAVQEELTQAAKTLGLKVLNKDETHEFIEMLNREVNKKIEL